MVPVIPENAFVFDPTAIRARELVMHAIAGELSIGARLDELAVTENRIAAGDVPEIGDLDGRIAGSCDTRGGREYG